MTGSRERGKKRGPQETAGKKRASFVFRNQFLISLCFSPNQRSPPPILLCSPPSPPLLLPCVPIRFGEENTWDFPTVVRAQAEPHAHTLSVSPSTPSVPCQEGVLRKTIHAPPRRLHICGRSCCAKQYVAMPTINRKTYSF